MICQLLRFINIKNLTEKDLKDTKIRILNHIRYSQIGIKKIEDI